MSSSGDGNLSNIAQGGSYNNAFVTQGSDANISNVNQSGNGNTATVTQGM